jgi:methyl-accepting chemotaxis protein
MEQIVTSQHSYRTRLFLFTLIVVLLGAALAAFGIFALLPNDLGTGYGSVITTVQGISDVLIQKVAMIYVVIVIGIVFAMVILHLFYSNRVAGPAYRLSKEAAKISEGNLVGKIKFRQRDNLTQMADSLNGVADRHRQRVESLKNHLSQVEAQSDALMILMQQGKNDPALETVAEDITANIKDISKVLSEIRA